MTEGLENICRVCLSFEGNFYPLHAHGLDYLFEQITGLQAKGDNRLPSALCEKCNMELRSYQNFQLTSKQSNDLFYDVLMRFQYITKQFIERLKQENLNNTRDIKLKDIQASNLLNVEQSEIKIKDDINSDSDNDFRDVFTQSVFTSDNATADHINATVSEIDADKFDIDATVTDIDAVKPHIDAAKIDARKKKKSKRKLKKDVKTKPNQDIVLDKRKSMSVKEGDQIVKMFFNLKLLTYEEQIANLRKRQQTDKYIAAPFKCTECFTGFLSESLFNNHMVRHTDTWGRYQCEICKAHFKSKHTIMKHIIYGAHNQQFTCKNCDFVTAHKSTAIQHAQWHQGTSYRCQHCQHLFTRLSSYMNHLRVKHASEFVCALCGHNFVTEKGLTQHKSRQHRLNSAMVVDGPTCTTCDIKFVSDDALNTHMRVSPKHVIENKIWSSNYTYKRGMPITEGGQYVNKYRSKKKIIAAGQISCEQCGLPMENARAYYRHFRRLHPDKTRTHYPTVSAPSMCHVCGRIFQSITHLNHHITKHSGDKPFKCEECNKRFPNKLYLGMHMKRHMDKLSNVSYPCQMCEKTFTLACNRDKHLKVVHSDARPFSCDVCGKAFKSKYEKKAHTDYVHHKKPWPKRQRQRDAGGTRATEIEIDVEFEHLL